MNIGEVKGLFTKALIDVYSNKATATSFLRSWFTEKVSRTKNVSIEVRLGTEKIAVDVVRGTEGNRNAANKSSEKIITPPYFKEWINATSLDFYDRVFGDSGSLPSPQELSDYVNELAESMVLLQDKIDRATELQCAQIFETGVLSLAQATSIDYKRQGASMVDATGNTWATGTNDPATDLKNGAKWLRANALTKGNIFDVLCGDDVYDALINNATFQAKSDLRDIHLNDIDMPSEIKTSTGSVFHGLVSAGSYKFRIWTYPQVYTPAAGGAKVPYLNAKKFVMLPPNPTFTLAYGAVPHLRTDPTKPSNVSIAHTAGKYVIDDYVDVTKEAHIFSMKSAPVAVPVQVNGIYTAQVLA